MQEAAGDLVLRIGINTGVVVTGDERTTLVTGDAVNTAKRLEQARPRRRDPRRSGDRAARRGTRWSSSRWRRSTRRERAPPVEAWRVLGADAPAPRRSRAARTRRSSAGGASSPCSATSSPRHGEPACRLVTVVGAAGVRQDAARVRARRRGRRQTRPSSPGAASRTATGSRSGRSRSFCVRSAASRAVADAVREEPDAALIVERLGALDARHRTRRKSSSGRCDGCSRRSRATSRSSSCSRTSTGPSRRSSTSSSTSAAGAATRRFSSSASRGPSCSRSGRGGKARSCGSNRSRPTKPTELLARTRRRPALSRRSCGSAWPRRRRAIRSTPSSSSRCSRNRTGTLELSELPPTIQALLSARLDRLEPAERDVLERAAVIGKDFWPGAVAALGDGDQPLGATLLELVRRELVEPATSTRSRRGRLQLPPRAHPGTPRTPASPATPCRASRALRRLARVGSFGEEYDEIPRLPPRAGAPLPGGARPPRRPHPVAWRAGW